MSSELRILGLTPAEETAYRTLVEQGPAPEPAEAESLVSKGLASLIDGVYVAVAPDIALEVLLLDREKKLREAREHIDELSLAYRKHIATPTRTLAELVSGADAVRQRITQVQQAARTELRRLLPAPQAASPQVEPPHSVSLRAGCRTVYARAALPVDSLLSQARVLPSVPIELYLADDRLALVLLGSGRAVILQPCGLLSAYAELFERLWEHAVPVSSDTAGTDQAEAELVSSLLLAGLTDQAIARQLGVSPRTAQRKIAALMQTLGARTRFQAGAQAAIRGHGS